MLLTQRLKFESPSERASCPLFLIARRPTIAQHLPDDLAKKLTKMIRDEFPKVKSQIQGDAVRVSGKSKDDLQKVITRLRELDEVVELQFQNYR